MKLSQRRKVKAEKCCWRWNISPFVTLICVLQFNSSRKHTACMSFNIVFSPLSAFRRVGSSRVLHKETNVDTERVFLFFYKHGQTAKALKRSGREKRRSLLNLRGESNQHCSLIFYMNSHTGSRVLIFFKIFFCEQIWPLAPRIWKDFSFITVQGGSIAKNNEISKCDELLFISIHWPLH